MWKVKPSPAKTTGLTKAAGPSASGRRRAARGRADSFASEGESHVAYAGLALRPSGVNKPTED